MLSALRFRILRRWGTFRQSPFGRLLGIFTGRILRGTGESFEESLGFGMGAVLILLAMPGILLSLLMLEEYGSLVRFMSGTGAYDPYTATIPDEYVFVVLSMTVSGATALWGWDSLFPDRRDYTNLVVLPIRLGTIFWANLLAVVALAALCTLVVNAASALLFPAAVVGSQNSFAVFFLFAAGHLAAVSLASIFSFATVLALAGVLMAVFPASLFRRVSLLARFLIATCLFALVATSLVVRPYLEQTSRPTKLHLACLPPVWFVGISQSVWGNVSDPTYSLMTRRALAALALSLVTAVVAYAVAFRACFARLPETAELSPLPPMRLRIWPLQMALGGLLPSPPEKACYDFILRTIFRSQVHLQVALAFLGLGLVAASASLSVSGSPASIVHGATPSVAFLAAPFILAYCVLAGVRIAFEIPVDTRANWIFRFWLHPHRLQTRAVARRVLQGLTLPWLLPVVFAATLIYFGAGVAFLHTIIVFLADVTIIEILLVSYQKMPFTCPLPAFESRSGVILLAYFFGFLAAGTYLPSLEDWALRDPVRAFCFGPIFGVLLAAVFLYRKQMLEMDKQLVFEEPPSLGS